MAIDYRFADDGRGLIYEGRGALDGEEVRRITAETEPLMAGLAYHLIDLSDVESMDLSRDDLRGIAETDIRTSARHGDMLVAIVGSKDIVYGLARMYQAFVEEASWEVEVFRDLGAAKAWINEHALRSLGREMTFA